MGVLCFSLNERWINICLSTLYYVSHILALSEMLLVSFFSAAHSRILFFMIGTSRPPLHLTFTAQMYLTQLAKFSILICTFFSVFLYCIFWCTLCNAVPNSAFLTARNSQFCFAQCANLHLLCAHFFCNSVRFFLMYFCSVFLDVFSAAQCAILHLLCAPTFSLFAKLCRTLSAEGRF